MRTLLLVVADVLSKDLLKVSFAENEQWSKHSWRTAKGTSIPIGGMNRDKCTPQHLTYLEGTGHVVRELRGNTASFGLA